MSLGEVSHGKTYKIVFSSANEVFVAQYFTKGFVT